MKTLMKKVGGSKKPRFWNMAQFQPRRWHREQEALARAQASNGPASPSTASSPGPAQEIPNATPEQSPGSTPPQKTGTDQAAEQPAPTQPAPMPNEAQSTKQSAVPPFTEPAPAQKSAQEPPDSSSASELDVESDVKKRFMHLRANGWSFRSIGKKLGIPKSTLFNWESDPLTRHGIDVMRSLKIEHLQEEHFPSFEEELRKVSAWVARLERALEKQDFEKLRPEFLLRTTLQLRKHLQSLRCDTHPTDTANKGPNPKIRPGCISRSELVFNLSEDAEPNPSSGSAQTPPVTPAATGNLRNPPVNSQTEKWDTNKNSQLSQPSSPTTSDSKVGTAVPLSQSSDGNNTAPLRDDGGRAELPSAQIGSDPSRNQEIAFCANFNSPSGMPRAADLATPKRMVVPNRSGGQCTGTNR